MEGSIAIAKADKTYSEVNSLLTNTRTARPRKQAFATALAAAFAPGMIMIFSLRPLTLNPFNHSPQTATASCRV